jgi:hypothetical protein
MKFRSTTFCVPSMGAVRMERKFPEGEADLEREETTI